VPPDGTAAEGDGQPERLDFLRQAGDADGVLVDALADDAQVAAELIDGELLIGERFPRCGGLVVNARVDGLERGGELIDGGGQLLLELLCLLLQHPDVGHHLHLAARLRRGRARAKPQHHKTQDARPKARQISSSHASHFTLR
jgi:hypothetical protein